MTSYLRRHGIYHNNIKRALFDNFLLKPGHEHYLQDYLIFCCVNDLNKLNRIINAFEFTLSGGMTYAQLFNIDKEWIGYFRENAWQCGILRVGDTRPGVSSEVVNSIMRKKNSGYTLEEAIIESMPSCEVTV